MTSRGILVFSIVLFFICVTLVNAYEINIVKTFVTILNSPPTITNVDIRIEDQINDYDRQLYISTKISDSNSVEDIDSVIVYFTDENNFRSDFDKTIWLNQYTFEVKENTDSAFIYYGMVPYPEYTPYYIGVQAFDRSGSSGKWVSVNPGPSNIKKEIVQTSAYDNIIDSFHRILFRFRININ